MKLFRKEDILIADLEVRGAVIMNREKRGVCFWKYRTLFFIGMMLAALLTGCGKERTVQEPAEPQEKAADTKSETEITSETESVGIVFTGLDVDGNSVSESVFSESKLTMVNVWATYCNPCLSEMPGLGELAGEYEQGEFQIIGIVSDVQEGADKEAVDGVKALIEATGANYTHLLLNESVYFALLTDVTAVPTTFFVDENGAVLDTVIGAMKKSAWEEKINGLLEER